MRIHELNNVIQPAVVPGNPGANGCKTEGEKPDFRTLMNKMTKSRSAEDNSSGVSAPPVRTQKKSSVQAAMPNQQFAYNAAEIRIGRKEHCDSTMTPPADSGDGVDAAQADSSLSNGLEEPEHVVDLPSDLMPVVENLSQSGPSVPQQQPQHSVVSLPLSAPEGAEPDLASSAGVEAERGSLKSDVHTPEPEANSASVAAGQVREEPPQAAPSPIPVILQDNSVLSSVPANPAGYLPASHAPGNGQSSAASKNSQAESSTLFSERKAGGTENPPSNTVSFGSCAADVSGKWSVSAFAPSAPVQANSQDSLYSATGTGIGQDRSVPGLACELSEGARRQPESITSSGREGLLVTVPTNLSEALPDENGIPFALSEEDIDSTITSDPLAEKVPAEIGANRPAVASAAVAESNDLPFASLIWAGLKPDVGMFRGHVPSSTGPEPAVSSGKGVASDVDASGTQTSKEARNAQLNQPVIPLQNSSGPLSSDVDVIPVVMTENGSFAPVASKEASGTKPVQPEIPPAKENPQPPVSAARGENRSPEIQTSQFAAVEKTVPDAARAVKSNPAAAKDTVQIVIPGSSAATDLKPAATVKVDQTPAGRLDEFILQLADRIYGQVRASEGEVRIHLRPENLGNLEIKAETGAGGIVARIAAESSSVKQILENNLHTLQQNLQEQGLKIDRIDVVLQQGLDARQSGNANQQQSGQTGDGHRGEQSSTNGTDARSHSSFPLDDQNLDSTIPTILGPNSTFHTIA